MTDHALKTLLHPFVSGELEIPAAGTRALFLGAPGGFVPPAGFSANLACVQPFRPDFLALQKAGYDVRPRAEGDGFDAALIVLGRHRALNEARLAEALLRTRPGGLILAAGGIHDGADSLAKRMAKILPGVERLSKHHGVAFWLTVPENARAAADAIMPAPAARLDGGFRTGHGLFSSERIDSGSFLLAEALPTDLKGRVADFCGGWAYLAVAALVRCPAIASLDLYEAEFEAVEAARDNLARLAPGREAHCHWTDLLSEPAGSQYDAIIMNPPFHQGRAASPSLGASFVKAAQAALKRGGRLFVVANRALPYESELTQGFARSGELVRDKAFKVLWAVK